MDWFKGKNYRKAPYLMGISMVSCRFSPTNQSIDPWDKLTMRSNSSKISLGSSPEAS